MASLERAIAIAAKAHEGQTDKADNPYILHPLRIMMKMTSPEAQIIAVLHDVVEDCPPDDKWTFDRLRVEGFSEEIVEALDCLTERDGEPYDELIGRAAPNPLARAVKLGDLEDNLNTLRIRSQTQKDLERIEKLHRSWQRLAALK